MDATLTSTKPIATCWAKTVTGVDLAQRGGFALDGKFADDRAYFRDPLHAYFSHIPLVTSNEIVVVGGTLYPTDGSFPSKENSGPRFAFLIYTLMLGTPISQRKEIISDPYANVEITVNSALGSRFEIMARGEWVVDPGNESFLRAAVGDALWNDNRILNPYYFMAAFICQNLTGRVPIKSLPANVPIAPPLTPRPVATFAESVSVAPLEKHSESSHNNHKRGRGVRTSDGTRVRPPDGCNFVTLDGGLVMVSMNGETSLKPLNILLNFGSLSDEFRKLINEQAEVLENFAATYRIAGYNGGS